MNFRISGVDIYHPENKVHNNYYLKHFKQQGKDIGNLLTAFGREYRPIINSDSENTITLAVEASKRVLKGANLTGKDIDAIIFASQLPEYTFPSQSLILHGLLEGKEDCLVLDVNVNCVGMLVAFDTAYKHLLASKSHKRALVIGADYISTHCRSDDELTYAQFGDCGCALILEKTEDNCESNILATDYKTDGQGWDLVKYPACGSSNLYKSTDPYDRKLHWPPFDGLFVVNHAKKSIQRILKEQNLKLEDISMFCVSQYAKGITDGFTDIVGVPSEKVIYVGDMYGYTGVSSPFIAFYEAIKEGKINRGDLVCLWSVGVFWTTTTILLRY